MWKKRLRISVFVFAGTCTVVSVFLLGIDGNAAKPPKMLQELGHGPPGGDDPPSYVYIVTDATQYAGKYFEKDLDGSMEEGLNRDVNKWDTDGDGVSDGDEVHAGTNPAGPGTPPFSALFADGLRGRILLQVQKGGQAWYVNPSDGKRYYMRDGSAAYQIMRFLSLGISNDDLRKIGVGEVVP